MATTLTFQYTPNVIISGTASTWPLAGTVSMENVVSPTVTSSSPAYSGTFAGTAVTKANLDNLYKAVSTAGFETAMHTHFKGAIQAQLLADLNLADVDAGNEFSALSGFSTDYDAKWDAFKAFLVTNEGAKPVLTTVDKLHIVFTFTSAVSGFTPKVAVYEVPIVA